MRNQEEILFIFFIPIKESYPFHFLKLGYNKTICVNCMTKGAIHKMNTFIVILVMVAFLSAIFTAGYNDKPGSSK
ncbi:hypothetical protein BACCIP111895_00805 [Neobacillus rhizosphaerae]|uniref:Transmembrane protein n=1 Tax=Neobacillus rhizosphaerae TaxID=2880965 RepID=A0ABM9EM45_9BACI|nr:hypothetical protein BACCIP111895_00805 [Neobacillus rhizosphaerae]